MAILGYARVSTDGQDLTLQKRALKEAGCAKIYEEKMSGAKDDRPKLARMLKDLQSGDVVIVTKLDRLGRSAGHLLSVIDRIRETNAEFRSLGDPWADTTNAQGKFFLTVMAGLAELERSMIRERTQAGIKHAREIGVKFGPKFKLNPKQCELIRERYTGGETMEAIAKDFRVGTATIWRVVHGAKVAA
jgi:DNA invertase Pin-like site-specific DNA recombinase